MYRGQVSVTSESDLKGLEAHSARYFNCPLVGSYLV